MRSHKLFKFVALLFLAVNSSLFAQFVGSRENDSLALVAIRTSNPNSNLWVDSSEISSWEGVTVTDNRVSELSLMNKSLSILPPEIGNLTNLEVLNFENNNIVIVPPEIGVLTKLSRLTLISNFIEFIPSEIENLTELTELWFSQNFLDSIPPEIGKLVNLKSLDFRNNEIVFVSSEIGKLSNLLQLSLYGNELVTIPLEIGGLSNLQRIDLARNNLTHLPEEIGNMTNLTYLSVSYNSISAFPSGLGRLTNLKTLYFGSNLFKKYPEVVYSITSLEKLSSWYNPISTIPDGLSNLVNLKLLYIGKCLLSSFPMEIVELVNLTQLVISSSGLLFIPPELAQLRNLKELDIKENKLSFGDIEFCLYNVTKFLAFSPQDTLPTYLSKDSSYVFVRISGAGNSYQWYKNGSVMDNEISDRLIIDKLELDSNTYNCIASSTQLPTLKLVTSISLTPVLDTINPIQEEKTQVSKCSQLSMSLNRNKLSISIPKEDMLTLSIYDLKGRIIEQLFSRNLSAGSHSFLLKNELAKGIYTVHLSSKSMSVIRKLSIK